MSGTAWIAGQLLGKPVSRSAAVRTQFGNRTAGQPSTGSASEKVLAWLELKPAGTWWSTRAIVTGTGCTQTAVGWALIFLRHTDRVRAAPDEQRHPRFLKYQSVAVNPRTTRKDRGA